MGGLHMKEIFISYSSNDLLQAETVRNVLEKNGLSCWMAPRDIPGGSNYTKEIPIAIRNCKIFVLILSKSAQSSHWVLKELDSAVNCGKVILPFMLEDCALNDEFNFCHNTVSSLSDLLPKKLVGRSDHGIAREHTLCLGVIGARFNGGVDVADLTGQQDHTLAAHTADKHINIVVAACSSILKLIELAFGNVSNRRESFTDITCGTVEVSAC